MPSRREFIQAGLAASVMPVALPVTGSESLSFRVDAASQSCHQLFAIVYDVRSPHSTAAASEGERLGLRVVRTKGDISDFWFNDLAPIWRTQPVAIAGLTAPGPLFCLERFGWDHGLRVVFRGVHRFTDAGYVDHELTGPFRTIASAHATLGADDWPTHITRLLSSCAVTHDTASTAVRAVQARGAEREIDDGLVSWVIAPKPADPTTRRS